MKTTCLFLCSVLLVPSRVTFVVVVNGTSKLGMEYIDKEGNIIHTASIDGPNRTRKSQSSELDEPTTSKTDSDETKTTVTIEDYNEYAQSIIKEAEKLGTHLNRRQTILLLIAFLSNAASHLKDSLKSNLRSYLKKLSPNLRRTNTDDLTHKLNELIEKSKFDLCKDFGVCNRNYFSEFLNDILLSAHDGITAKGHRIFEAAVNAFCKTKYFKYLRRFTKTGIKNMPQKYSSMEGSRSLKIDMEKLSSLITANMKNTTVANDTEHNNEIMALRKVLDGVDQLYTEKELQGLDELAEDFRLVMTGRKTYESFISDLFNNVEQKFHKYPEVITKPILRDFSVLLDMYTDLIVEITTTEVVSVITPSPWVLVYTNPVYTAFKLK